MKKKLLTFFVLQMLFCGLMISPVQAIPLGSFDVNIEMGSITVFDQIKYRLIIEDGLSYYSGATFDFILSADDVGQTFTVSSGAEFDEGAMYLTNGSNNLISNWVYGYPNGAGAGHGSTEAYLFSDDYTENGIDFAGFEITGIDMTLNSLNLDSHGYWTDVSFNATVVIDGISAVVPEPATFFLLGIGLAGTILCRRIKGKV
ncbi:MAG: PEP-CTERM sorting domain-containing protein [Desulfobacteraceae bacterium]|nr:PEP-CTERM sorting domain-containing protein [Desulfobacteraceae bacterium]